MNNISLEDFLLRYYDRYEIRVLYDDWFFDRSFSDEPIHNEVSNIVIFEGKFDNDIELVKFIDEFNFDEIYFPFFRLVDDYDTQDLYVFFDSYYNIINIYVKRLLISWGCA